MSEVAGLDQSNDRYGQDQLHFEDPVALEQSLLEPIEDTTGGELGPFLAEFAKMQQALRKSHESETRFVNKCRELAQGLQEANERATELDFEESENQKKVEILQKQCDLANEAKESLHEDIMARNDQIATLRSEVTALKKKMETWSQVLLDEQQKAIGALEQELGVLSSSRDKSLRHLTFVRGENAAVYTKIDQLEKEKQRQQDDINDLQRRISEIENSCRSELEKKDELELKTAELKEECGQQSLEINRKIQRTKKAKQELAKEKAQLKESMKSGSTLSTRLTQLNEEAQDLEDKFQTQQDYTEEVLKSIASLRSSCDTDKATLAATTKESKRKLSMLEKLKEKMQVADEDLRSIEATRGLWNEKIEQKKNELKVANTAAAVALRAIDIASREREILNHDHATMMEGLSGKRNALHIAENQSRNMEIELKAFDVSIKAWKTLIDQLAQDTDTFKNELEVKQARTKKAMEKSAAKDSQVMGMQKMIIEHETKRRQQMNLLEAVKSDRNLYTKTLLEQKHEMNEYKRSFDSLNHSISHMQQELNDKESAFVNENLLVEQADDDIRQTDLKTKHIHECYLATNERVQVQSTQIANLSRIIDEADEELQAQTKQYNAVVNEERVLSRQLVKRNEELSEIYEQLRLHHSMMHKGEIHYKERREVFSKLEALQSALTAELNSIDVDRSEIDELKSAIIRLEKSLSKETLKARVLEDELKKPMNIHRWRQLQDTSADTFTLIESVQGLQKSIIAKSAELAAKDAKIEQREKLYVDLRRIQARQIGQEVHEQLRIYEAEIKEKTGKHKIMLIELKLCQARVHELKYEIENVYKSLDLVKLTYFQRQRAETRAKSRLTAKSGEESHSLFARYDGFSSKGSLDFDLKVYDEGNETQKHIEGEITLKK